MKHKTQRILVLQYREDITREHEQDCINAFADGNITFDYKDILDSRFSTENPAEFLEDYDKVILGGSAGLSMGPGHEGNDYTKIKIIMDKMRPILDYITEKDIPTLGSCFGFHLIANFLGSPVEKNTDTAETGFAEIILTEEGQKDPLFAGIETSFHAVVGHGDSVLQLPKNCTLLASSKDCPIHAFKYKQHIYANQFHPELDEQGLQFRLNLFPKYAQYARDLRTQDCSQTKLIMQNFLGIDAN
jgi:GMP synthase (glutamine-hydrolysing)